MWASGKLYKPGKISTWERMKETDRRATRHYATLGTGFVPNCSGLRGREKPELYETCKSREVMRNKDNSILWDNARLMKAEKQGETKMIQSLEVAL